MRPVAAAAGGRALEGERLPGGRRLAIDADDEVAEFHESIGTDQVEIGHAPSASAAHGPDGVAVVQLHPS